MITRGLLLRSTLTHTVTHTREVPGAIRLEGTNTSDNLPQCSIKDTECIKGVYQHMMNSIGSTGAEELGIPALDPMILNNISVNLMKDLTITVSEGTVKGMRNCVFNTFKIDWEKEKGYLNVTCDALSVKGNFVVSGENKQIQSIIGSNSLTGDGRAKVKLDNTKLNIEFSITLKKKDDGDIYLSVSNKNIKYTYDIGKAHFVIEKVVIANNDLSQIVSSYLNDNWRSVMDQFGSVFIEKALELYVDLVANMCDKIPGKKFITEDLHSYLKH
ncbi:unnamed protein product, partial [Brenthis ino]